MKGLKKLYFRFTSNGFAIWCPACKCGHLFDTRWTLNEKSMTVTPSMNVENGKCHFNITNGKIIYHECKHELSGKTIDMIKF